jgi:hypothetical protein
MKSPNEFESGLGIVAMMIAMMSSGGEGLGELPA